jgi:hypothetical protein
MFWFVFLTAIRRYICSVVIYIYIYIYIVLWKKFYICLSFDWIFRTTEDAFNSVLLYFNFYSLL